MPGLLRINTSRSALKYYLIFLWYAGTLTVSAQTDSEYSAVNQCITEIGLIKVDPCNHSFSFPARVNMEKGLIEVVLCIPSGKSHESVFVTDVDPISFEAALTLIGCIKTDPYARQIKKPGDVKKIKHRKKKPDRVEIFVEYTDSLNNTHLRRIEDFIWDQNANSSLANSYWHFKGIPTDENGNPYTYMGNNLVVSFVETDAILELDSPMLFDDNYLFANHHNKELFARKNVIIHVKQIQ
ncbi:MAG: YdjY domain-containing protein [Bacteroidales bacterium]